MLRMTQKGKYTRRAQNQESMKATKMAVDAASAPQYLHSLAASMSTSLTSWHSSTMEPTRKNLRGGRGKQAGEYFRQ